MEKLSGEVVDSNPYSRLMALQRMGIVKDYEAIRTKTVRRLGLACGLGGWVGTGCLPVLSWWCLVCSWGLVAGWRGAGWLGGGRLAGGAWLVVCGVQMEARWLAVCGEGLAGWLAVLGWWLVGAM